MDTRQRIIQELVPGKQLTLAHIIANPDATLYESLKITSPDAIGILTITPSETAIIIADVAIKSAGVGIASIDITSGSLIITGTVSQIESAVGAILDYVGAKLGFEICKLTKT